MLCESLQIVFWTVSFVCRIYSRWTCTYVHIRIYTCNIPSKFAFSSCICVAFGKETNPVVFLAHVNIVCGLSDISGWIYHAAIHCSASRYISCKNNTRSDANMRKRSRSLYPLFEKNLIYTRYLFLQTLYSLCLWNLYISIRIYVYVYYYINLLNSILLNVIVFLLYFFQNYLYYLPKQAMTSCSRTVAISLVHRCHDFRSEKKIKFIVNVGRYNNILSDTKLS